MYNSLLKDNKTTPYTSKIDIETEEIKIKKDQIEYINILLEYIDWKIKNHKEDENIKKERNKLQEKKKIFEEELEDMMSDQ